MGRKLDQLVAELRGNIQQYITAAQRVCLCADIWSKEGLSSSYLGVTAHFFSKKDHQKHNVTLAVRKFAHPHTGEQVREVVGDVLKEWGIAEKKVVAVLTDNSSNMLKVFHKQVLAEMDDDDKEETHRKWIMILPLS